MNEEILAYYQKKEKETAQSFEQAEKWANQVSYLRLGVFVAGAAVSYGVLQQAFLMGILVSSVAVIGFLLLVKYHQRLDEKSKFIGQLLSVYQRELRVSNNDLDGLEDGAELQVPGHRFSHDLDIFGPRSVFQYINRTVTRQGYILLGNWFGNPLHQVSKIVDRQVAVQNLAAEKDFVERFLALGAVNLKQEESPEIFSNWLEQPVYFLSKKWLLPLMIVLPIGLIGMILAAASVPAIPLYAPLLYAGLHLVVVRQFLPHTQKAYVMLNRRYRELTKYSQLIKLVEGTSFSAGLLSSVQEQLKTGDETASEALGRLASIMQQFDNRLNFLAALVLNGLFMWDLWIMRRLEKWKLRHQDHLVQWLEELAVVDALVSLGNYAHNRPEFQFPRFTQEAPTLVAENLGHPLLDPTKRVDNNLEMAQDGFYLLITGANMAGKSTFLRTVGVNLVLGMMGAPCCATSFTFSPMGLYTSVRTTDSLQDDQSYFFAELVRLQGIVERLREGERLFIILDEMLRGTNSKDKQNGSMGLIRQLVQYKGMGLIATHDLALGKLQNEFPDRIKNMRFEVEIDGDELHFDYKLQPGISQNLNATFLMEKMGII
ncbi:MAG: hypothetical protein AAGI38_19695 [Bacteroidota bacterium]